MCDSRIHWNTVLLFGKGIIHDIQKWGNPLDMLLHRFMVSEGVENDNNTDDSLRLAGRVAVS